MNGAGSYEGNVQVCNQGEWGYVCGNSWSTNDARVVCRQLGYAVSSNSTCVKTCLLIFLLQILSITNLVTISTGLVMEPYGWTMCTVMAQSQTSSVAQELTVLECITAHTLTWLESIAIVSLSNTLCINQ